MDVQVRRKGSEPAAHATSFLRACTEEKLVQLSMLADAAFESLAVTRFFDSEDFDISAAPHTIARFLHRIDVLFVQGQVKDLGHTQLMQKHLTTERTCILPPENALKSLGGPGSISDDVLERCLTRMSIWVRLTGERLEAEFPSWRLLASFRVFDLIPLLPDGSRDERLEPVEQDLKRLADCFEMGGGWTDYCPSFYTCVATASICWRQGRLPKMRRPGAQPACI